MARPLPERPNLEQLKKQARERQRDTGGPLHEAQLALAREYGFASWPRLRAHVSEIEARTWTWSEPRPDEPPAHRFLRLATVSYDRGHDADPESARGLLAALPPDDLAVAAVRGDPDAVARLLDAGVPVDPPLPPFGWPALMYLCYSRLDIGEAATVRTAQMLLDAGADPNEGRYFLGYPTPFTLLTGVFGDGEDGQPVHPHAFALARVLLRAGADPNDEQTLYNRMFATEDDFLHLLFDHGLGTGDGGPWHARLPDLSAPPQDMLRDLLDWAIVHDQRERVALLARHGVDVSAPLPGGRTPVATALVNGHRELAELIRTLAADQVFPAGDRSEGVEPVGPEENPIDTLIGDVLAGDRVAVGAAPPEIVDAVRRDRPGLIVWAASLGRAAAVELLADGGWDVDVLARGDVPSEQPWQTALHSAIQNGHRDVVELLLRLGARTDVRDARFDGTAADWARHFERSELVPMLE